MNKTDKAEQQAIDEADRRMRQAYRTVANKICGHKYVPRETMGDAVTDSRTVAGDLYLLTDGAEIFARKEMTEDEAREANETALRHTSGNVQWRKFKKA